MSIGIYNNLLFISLLSFLDFCDSNIDKNLKALKRHMLIRKSEIEILVENTVERIRFIEQNTPPNEFFRLSEIDMIKITECLTALIKENEKLKSQKLN